MLENKSKNKLSNKITEKKFKNNDNEIRYSLTPHPGSLADHHCVKSVRIRSYSGPNFPAFGLNTGRYLSNYGIKASVFRLTFLISRKLAKDAFIIFGGRIFSWSYFREK